MKPLFTLLSFLAYLNFVNAQKEAANWVFGNHAGISWNTGSPVPFSGAAVTQNEGVCCISDAAGVLLFYSDGMRVWNAQHAQMPNGTGLQGNSSSTQSGVIVPWPGSSSKYFIFTADAFAATNGLKYSVVDMSLQSGLGDVEVASKNTALYAPSCEKITAIRHANGNDVWVVSHDWNNNSFYAHLVTSAGVSTTPVVTSIGSVHSGITQHTIGYMKISPDSRKLGLVVDYSMFAEFFDFDNSTGQLSNAVTISYTSMSDHIYGMEFSPNSRYAYIASYTNNEIFQFDLQAGSGAAILASKYTVAASGAGSVLQLAIDNKIYVSKSGATSLSVINNPDVGGSGCNFQTGAVTLSGTAACTYGLPNFMPSFFSQQAVSFSYQNTCLNGTTSFTVNASTIDSVRWDFGDVASGASNVSTQQNAAHIFTAAGTYTVTVVVWHDGVATTVHNDVIIQPAQNSLTIAPASSLICPSDSVEICAPSGMSSYLWNNGATTDCIMASQAGNYYVTATENSGCVVVSNHASVSVYPSPPVSISVSGDTLTAYNAVTYQWYLNGNTIAGATGGQYIANQSGSYTVIVTDINGCRATSNAIVISGIYSSETTDVGSRLHPNPATGQLFIKTTVPVNDLYIYNAEGALVMAVKGAFKNVPISIASLASGVYVVEIKTKDVGVRKRLVKM